MPDQPYSRLPGLMNEPPINLYPSLAARTGVNQAAILQEVHFLVTLKRQSGDEIAFHDGHYWVYNTYANWQRRFFFWMSVATVKRLFQELERVGILLSRPYEHDARTKWYTLNTGYWETWFKLTPKDDKKRIKKRRNSRSKESALAAKGDQTDPEKGIKKRRNSGSKESVIPDQSDPHRPIYKESEDSPEDSAEESAEESPPPNQESDPSDQAGDKPPPQDGGGGWDYLKTHPQFAAFMDTLAGNLAAEVRAMDAITALAWWHDVQTGTNPPGLLKHRLAQPHATPTVASLDKARQTIHWRRELEALAAQTQQDLAQRAAEPEPVPTYDTASLDEKPAGKEWRWRDVWRATLGQLKMELNRSTYQNWLAGTRAVQFADGVLTVRVRHAAARDVLNERFKHAIDPIVQNLAGDETVRVEFVAPLPAYLRFPDAAQGQTGADT